MEYEHRCDTSEAEPLSIIRGSAHDQQWHGGEGPGLRRRISSSHTNFFYFTHGRNPHGNNSTSLLHLQKRCGGVHLPSRKRNRAQFSPPDAGLHHCATQNSGANHQPVWQRAQTTESRFGTAHVSRTSELVSHSARCPGRRPNTRSRASRSRVLSGTSATLGSSSLDCSTSAVRVTGNSPFRSELIGISADLLRPSVRHAHWRLDVVGCICTVPKIEQLGPDLPPVVRSKVFATHLSTGNSLNCDALINGYRPSTRQPLVDQSLAYPEANGERCLGDLLRCKVG